MATEDEESTEVSVASVYCVVYRLENADWVVTGEGWSQVHLYRDEADGTYRLVGWLVDGFRIVLNANVLPGTKIKKKSPDFHKFTSEEGTVYGFGYFKKEESIRESEVFLAAIEEAIRTPVPPPPPAAAAAAPAPAPAPAAAAPAAAAPAPGGGGGGGGGGSTLRDRIQSLSQASGSSVQTTAAAGHSKDASLGGGPLVEPYNHSRESKVVENMQDQKCAGALPLGQLPIMPAKAQRRQSAMPPPLPPRDGPREVSDPTEVVHLTSVKYDPASRSYQGLPPEWRAALARQFGLPPSKVECTKVEGYESRIPAVLIQMRDYLFANGGLEVEGIFRLAPDADEQKIAKQQLNEGTFQRVDDINCIANLIKVWLREMPEHLLDRVDRRAVEECSSEEDAGAVVDGMEEPYKSIFLWLLDMCVDVAEHKNKNLMSAKNLAIVIVPNLFTPSADNPMKALLYSQNVAQFMFKAITHRAATRGA